MSRQAYEVMENHHDLKVNQGEVVFEFTGNNYGIVSDDEAMLGEPCRAITRNPDGKNPFIVLPERILKKIDSPS